MRPLAAMGGNRVIVTHGNVAREHGYLRVRYESRHVEHLEAFICKKRGFCSSCAGWRIAESPALLGHEVFPEQRVRQWVLSVP